MNYRTELMNCEEISVKVFDGKIKPRTIRDVHSKLPDFPKPVPKTKPRLFPADAILRYYKIKA